MAAEAAKEAKARFEAFSKGAFLDVLLPRASDFDPAAILENGSAEDIAQTPSRRHLFFATPTDEVRHILSSANIVVAAHITDTVAHGSSSAAAAARKQDVASKTIPAAEVRDIIRQDERTFVVWKVSLHLPQPRVGLQRPALYFTANVTLQEDSHAGSQNSKKDFLKPFESLPENVLAPLNFAPEFREKNAYLSGDRITKVAPTATVKEDGTKPIRGASKRAFPAVPALFSGVSYSTVPDGVIASLHIQTSAAIAGAFTINEMRASVKDQSLLKMPEELQKNARRPALQALGSQSWPKDLRPGDELALLYKLSKDQIDPQQSSSSSGAVTIEVSISTSGTLETGSEIELDTYWQTQVDLSQKLSSPVYEWSRPRSAGSASSHTTRLSKVSNQQPSSKDEVPEPSTAGIDGTVFLISAPPTTHQRATFKVKVQCINQSKRPRHFHLSVVLPQAEPSWQHSQRSSKTSVKDADLVAEILHAPSLQPQKARSVQIESGDVKLGPVEAGASDEAWIKLRASASGVLDLGVLKITDLDNKHTVEVQELPDVIA